MRILVTSDWHLGKRLFGLDLAPYQQQVLDALLAQIEQEPPDLFLMAGDLFDSPRPSGEALRIFTQFLNRLSTHNFPAYFIAGNHDMPEMMTYLRPFLERAQIHNIGAAEPWDPWSPIPLSDGIYLVAVPHIPRYVLHKVMSNAEAGMKEFFYTLREQISAHEQVILLAHTFVRTGSDTLEDPEETLGYVELVPADALSGWGLVFTGHLHRHHQVGPAYYPGSILKYHPNEARHEKVALLVDWEPGQNPVFTLWALPQPVDFWIVRGRVTSVGTFEFTESPSPPSAEKIFVRAILEEPPGQIDLQAAILDACRALVSEPASLIWAGIERIETQPVLSATEETPPIPSLNRLDIIRAYLKERGFWDQWDEETQQAAERLLKDLLGG